MMLGLSILARGTCLPARNPRCSAIRGLHAAAAQNNDLEILREWAKMKSSDPTRGYREGVVNLEVAESGVAKVTLNRPEKFNAFNMQMFKELELAFQEIEDRRNEVRCVILGASGTNFTAGLDLNTLGALQKVLSEVKCPSEMRENLGHVIARFQKIFSMPEVCHVPVIAASQGLVVGAGVDIITACDLRFCTQDTRMTVKEVDVAIVADLGTLQRLPRIIGEQRARELAYTGRFVSGAEAANLGLVLDCLEDSAALETRASGLASEIASKSAITMRGIKANMNYSRDHSVQEGLEYVLRWNTSHLMSADLHAIAAKAAAARKK